MNTEDRCHVRNCPSASAISLKAVRLCSMHYLALKSLAAAGGQSIYDGHLSDLLAQLSAAERPRRRQQAVAR